ncbi:TIGR03663 family protein [Halarchaeum sp. CBA1220]|uniref:flippase activity-associated protein Agl23 n=1 Tax=Halarchaeum sp. CBA1220 TaxID=1853682 RepID=UPI000F3A8F5A|nr:flippase activity-associated protein Agl23 [Halarchaeum sp. CBA1220]QLC33962.1 TIGR03663 family protein [Halarchaeum sp. CBA1220]
MPDSDRRVAAAVAAATAVALVARLVALGARVAHWDEGRVGYWVLRYVETGQYTYHPIVHGPFLFHVNGVVFDLVGASDASMRAVVALIGGLLPATAWLLRDRLKPAETVSLAVLLAANPLLLYYSRFMRSDVLVGALAFAALAFLVRAHDTGRRRHLYAGALSLALAFTTKENVLVYVACWVGALVLLLDWMLLAARQRDEDPTAVLAERLVATARGLRPWARDVAAGGVLFFAVVVFFYAPRPELWRAFSNPALFGDVVRRATVGSVEKFANTWVGGHPHSYVDFFVGDVETLVAGAAAVCVLGIAGFVHDRYRGERPRSLVSFAGYWALASLVIYPAVSDIQAPWAMIHVVVPLAVPAAVGGGLLLSAVGSTRRDGDDAGTAIALVLVAAVVGWMAFTGVAAAFVHPQEPGPLVQYGQPNGDLHPTLAEIDDAVQAHQGGSGPDVLYYGDHFYAASEPSAAPDENFSEPGHWTWRLPLPWYFEGMGAETASTTDIAALNGSTPPVVITRASNYGEVAPRLEGYDATTYELTSEGTPTVFFVRQSGAGNASAANASPGAAVNASAASVAAPTPPTAPTPTSATV